ncbi:tail fiber protein [Escherichia coli]|nr:tail fiber protein [Escherichia coli]
MGNLNETEKWEENIYQLETSDPVLGGADGISNRAPRQLANRTKWLKKKTEEAAQSLAKHVRSRNHPDATLTAKGFTQLSSATNSTSETLAATPKAVKAAYDLAAGKAPVSHTHPWSQITGVPAASLTAKGTVQLSSATDSQSETEAATPKAVKAAYDLAAGKAPVSHTHPWSQITGVPAASLTAKGTVQLSSDINSTSEILAATPKAVKAAYDLANGKQPADATLTALAGLATAADRLPYFTGADRAALTTLTAIGRAIIAMGSIKEVLNYLGLGEAAKRNVGNGQNQIPDMAAFASSLSSTGFQKLPSGLIIQWGIVSGASNYTVTYPVTFPNRSLALLAVPHTTPVAGISAMGIANCSDISKSQFYIIVGGISHGEIVKYERSCFWVAIGV